MPASRSPRIGAFLSHIACDQEKQAVMPLLVLVVMAISYLTRPHERRILEAPAAVR